jgi:hypothetical protein
MACAEEHRVGARWLLLRAGASSSGWLATKNWSLDRNRSRKALVFSLLLTAYAGFGAIVWAAYLQIDPSPRRVPPVAVLRQTAVPDDAWRAWARHHTELQARIEAVLEAPPIEPRRSLPAVPHSSSPEPNLALVPPVPASSATMPPTPSPKPADLVATAISYAPPPEPWPIPTPSLKPREQPSRLLAMDRVRGATEPTSFWSRFAALFDVASASPIARRDDDRGDPYGGAGDGSGDQRDASESSRADSAASAGSASAASGGGASSSSSGGNSANSSSAASDGGANSSDSGRDSASSSSSGGSASNGDNGRSAGPSGGNDRGASSGDDGRSSGNDRGAGSGDNGRSSGNRGGGDRGGRGDRGDRGDRGRGHD